MSHRRQLAVLFARRAFQFGDFPLASGARSSYYINSKKVLFHSKAISLLGRVLYDSIKDVIGLEAVGGLEVGAIPMVSAVLQTYHKIENEPLEGFFVRKAPKDHGSQELIEGATLSAGSKVVIFDDVVTSGGSTLQAIRAVEGVGAEVVRVICICDRLQGARAALSKYDFRPIFTIDDFGVGDKSMTLAEKLRPALEQGRMVAENLNKAFNKGGS